MVNRSNQEWIGDLKSTGPRQESALSDLHAIILKGLPYGLSKWLSPTNPKFQPLAEEVAQDTLLRVLNRLDTFEGRSKFTTWVYKIAIRLAITELRRKRWENISLDELINDNDKVFSARFMSNSAPGPESSVTGAEMISLISRIIQEELTDKQRQAMIAIGIKGMPMEEVARRMGSNRNALYKLLHDARIRLKNRLALEGLTPEDVLSVFEHE